MGAFKNIFAVVLCKKIMLYYFARRKATSILQHIPILGDIAAWYITLKCYKKSLKVTWRVYCLKKIQPILFQVTIKLYHADKRRRVVLDFGVIKTEKWNVCVAIETKISSKNWKGKRKREQAKFDIEVPIVPKPLSCHL